MPDMMEYNSEAAEILEIARTSIFDRNLAAKPVIMPGRTWTVSSKNP